MTTTQEGMNEKENLKQHINIYGTYVLWIQKFVFVILDY